jgi:1-acyl-sn-glycerol-3-phosphate acyltransferase
LVIPLVRISSRNHVKIRRRLLGLISFSFWWFMQLMVVTRMLDRFVVEGGQEWRKRPCLVIANHPTLIDIVALFACLPRAGCVVKGSLRQHPFFGGVVRAAGYLPNDGGTELLEMAREHFAAGFSLVIFPEGSRSLREGLRPFYRGAARVALECSVPVVPVRIGAEPGFLRTGDRWYSIPDQPVDFRLDFHEPIEIPDEIRDDPVPTRQARRLTALFQTRIEEISQQRVVQSMPHPTSSLQHPVSPVPAR